jgi:tRNA pseudouridine38-40 synthase
MRIAVKLAYDGRKYHGYARQPHLKTVEGEILDALINNNYFSTLQEGKLRSASRTDKGVSALCNIITFTTDKKIDSLLQDLSDHSPSLIAYGLTRVDEGFNPRYAHLRHYRYYLPLEGLNMDEMLSTAALFTGTHDFTNFARIESMKNPVRTIENILFTANSSLLSIDFFAQTFLWHQIRRIIAALVKVNQEKCTMMELKDALDNPSTKIDFGLAPAEPLVLQQLWYKVAFEHDPDKVRAVNQLEHRLIRSLNIHPGESPERKNEKRNDPQD